MKGCQRKVIFIKNTGSRIFDEAYFIVSRESEASQIKESNLVNEANRIIEDSLDGSEDLDKRSRFRRVADFLIPFSIGALLSVSILFLSAAIF